MHLFELFDEGFLRYSAMFLSFVGLVKNNFLTDTFIMGAGLSADNDIAAT